MRELGSAERLEREAAATLASALGGAARAGVAVDPPIRRQKLEDAIALARDAVAASRSWGDDGATASSGASFEERLARTMVRAYLTLVRAHAARAEDARHGAGQLSQSAQRAPTLDACEEGWQRAQLIASEAERSASAAAALAAELQLQTPGEHALGVARAAAARAAKAADEARALVGARNLAYTFHVDGGFSFGEGWHVAAAAVLAGIAVQIEPDKPATAQAERFLHDAGLGGQLWPYRSRPRAMKQTTELVARAFRPGPLAAQRRLRAAFLGHTPAPPEVTAYADRRLGQRDHAGRPKVAVWVRVGAYARGRNTAPPELTELVRGAEAAGLLPVLVGDALPDGFDPGGAADLTLHWRDPIFRGLDGRRAQLQLFERLRQAHGLVGQIGVTTAGMDGPALMGLPTMYLTDVTNVRMGRWVGAVPGYQEIVRDAGYLEQVALTLKAWAAGATRHA
jgi:hypothetical protein